MSKGHDELIAEMLPAPFVIRGAIENMPECNYELYLTEFLNASSFFMGKPLDNPFVFQEDQSKGQCDCYAQIGTKEYGLDFKLFGSEKALQGKSIYSSQIIKIGTGAYAFAAPKEKEGSITGTWILSALKDKSLGELEEIERSTYQSNPDTLIQKELQGVLRKLKVRKNLFFLLTYRFHFPKDYQFDFDEEIDDLCRSLSDRLNSVIAFRNKLTKGYETYFSFFFEDRLIIAEFQNGEIVQRDCIHIYASKIFWELNTILDPFGGIRIREN